MLICKALFFEILGVQLNLFSLLFFLYIFYNSDHSFLLTLLYWIFVEACVLGLVGSRNLRLNFNMLICPVELCAQILNILSFFAVPTRFRFNFEFSRGSALTGENVRWQAIILVLPMPTAGKASWPGDGLSLL